MSVRVVSPSRLDDEDQRSAVEVHAAARARGARCDECILGSHCDRGPVLSEVRPEAPLVMIGSSVGPQEVGHGRPMMGASGQRALDAAASGGLRRAKISILNTSVCQPPDGLPLGAYVEVQEKLGHLREKGKTREEDPRPLDPTTACAPMFRRDFQRALEGAKTVCTLGEEPLRAVAAYWDIPMGGSRKIREGEIAITSLQRQCGAPILQPDGRPTIVPTYHTAWAMRKGHRHYAPIVQRHIQRAADLAKRGGQPRWKEPPPKVNPTVDEIEKFCGSLAVLGRRVFVDIETTGLNQRRARITCIGIGGYLDPDSAWVDDEGPHGLTVMVVPIRRLDGSPWWCDDKDRLRIWNALTLLFESCELSGHNFVSYDSYILLKNKLLHDWTRKFQDTALKHKNTDGNDRPHRLGWVTAEYFDKPAWKDDASDKYVEEVSDEREHRYCAKDVTAQAAIDWRINETIANLGTLSQNTTDWEVAPIYRNMGDLGLLVDMGVQKTLSDQFARTLDHESDDRPGLLQRLRAITKDPAFNPNGPEEVGHWLYQVKGHTPILSTDGEEWEEGESASTKALALTMLYERGPDEETKAFIDLLLAYRNFKKLKGTYIDGLVRERGKKGKKYTTIEWEDWTAEGFSSEWHEKGWLPYIHPEYQLWIPSGRVSCKPSVQNWPQEGKHNMRKLLVAPPGHVFVGADMEQVELRIYTAVADDRGMWKVFREGLDAHAWNFATIKTNDPLRNQAAVRALHDHIVKLKKSACPVHGQLFINGCAACDEAAPKYMKAKESRNIAKRFCFLLLYGGEPEKLYTTMANERDKGTTRLKFPGLQPSDTDQWYENWFKGHPETEAWQKWCADQVRRHGCIWVPMLDGRRRYFIGGANKKNAIPNHQIQGSSGSIKNRAVQEIARRIPHRGWSPLSGLCFDIHDFLGSCVPETRVDEARQVFEEHMPYEWRKMPFPIELKVDRCWANI